MKKSELRQIIREEISIIRESTDIDINKPFGVVFVGRKHNDKYYVPSLQGTVVATFDTMPEASEFAKRRKASLSKGEKEYYKLTYKTFKMIPSIKKELS